MTAALNYKDFLGIGSIVISIISIAIVFYDRRAKLVIRGREGNWTKLVSGNFLISMVEIYNPTSRPNTITQYWFSFKGSKGNVITKAAEICRVLDNPSGSGEWTCNETPLIIPPFSGISAPVAFQVSLHDLPIEFEITVHVVDLFNDEWKTLIRGSRRRKDAETES